MNANFNLLAQNKPERVKKLLKTMNQFRYICVNKFLRFRNKKKCKLATVVESDPKTPFSLATTLRCKEGRYFFPGLLPFTLDPHLLMVITKQGDIKYHFWVFDMTQPGIEPRFPGPLANILPTRSMGRYYFWNKEIWFREST